jgi:hypothetical protein
VLTPTLASVPQTCVFTWRALLQQARQRQSISLDIALVLVTASVLGSMFKNNTDLKKIGALALLASLGIGLSVGAASLRCFGDERIVFIRESTTGINRGTSWHHHNNNNSSTSLSDPPFHAASSPCL